MAMRRCEPHQLTRRTRVEEGDYRAGSSLRLASACSISMTCAAPACMVVRNGSRELPISHWVPAGRTTGSSGLRSPMRLDMSFTMREIRCSAVRRARY